MNSDQMMIIRSYELVSIDDYQEVLRWSPLSIHHGRTRFSGKIKRSKSANLEMTKVQAQQTFNNSMACECLISAFFQRVLSKTDKTPYGLASHTLRVEQYMENNIDGLFDHHFLSVQFFLLLACVLSVISLCVSCVHLHIHLLTSRRTYIESLFNRLSSHV